MKKLIFILIFSWLIAGLAADFPGWNCTVEQAIAYRIALLQEEPINYKAVDLANCLIVLNNSLIESYQDILIIYELNNRQDAYQYAYNHAIFLKEAYADCLAKNDLNYICYFFLYRNYFKQLEITEYQAFKVIELALDRYPKNPVILDALMTIIPYLDANKADEIKAVLNKANRLLSLELLGPNRKQYENSVARIRMLLSTY